MIDELPDFKEDIEMELSDTENNFEAVRNLSSGGVQVALHSIGNIYDTLLPYPQKEVRFCNWVKSGRVTEIEWKGPTPGFKPGKQIPPYRTVLSKDQQSEYDFEFVKQH